MSDEALVKVENVSKKFCRSLKKSLWYGVQDIAGELFGRNSAKADLRSEEFWALKDVSFELRRGDTLGLIGPNGAGKSTLLKLLNGLIKPDEGRIAVRGRMGALIALGAGFNPILTGRENIYVNAAVLGIPKREVDTVIDDIIAFSELEEFIDTPFQSYSSGMRVRLGFAVAAHLEPDILIIDEVLAVGDASFRRKCIEHLKRYVRNENTCLILVSHNLRHIEQTCERAMYLNRGHVVLTGDTDKVIERYLLTVNEDYAQQASQAGHVREGSGEVRFTNARVFSESGQEQFKPGDPITIEAEFECFAPCEFVRFRVGIVDVSTQTMITIANYDARELISGGRITCTFTDVHLLPRMYSVYLSATDLMLLYDRWPPTTTFVVSGARDEEMKYSVGDGELMRLPHRIDCELLGDQCLAGSLHRKS